MTTRIAGTNIQNATITGDDIASNTITSTNLSSSVVALLGGSSPTITQIQITDSSYNVLDDTAVASTGGYIKITGTNFTAGSQVVIGSVAATSVGFVSDTTLNVQVPAQAAGTYVVYVTTSNGSVAIRVNGLTYSGTPTWVTGSTLTSGQVDAAISIQLSATGDAPVTYALAAGSSLPAGLSLSSAGLLSGTVTGITVETTYNFTVNATDAEAQDSPRAFSITISASDPDFEYVTTLLSAATPASTFVSDASTNSFAVTVNGDARPSNFGPYTPGYYSNYFDGTGDYLTAPNDAAFALGTGAFTIECWVNFGSLLNKGVFHIAASYLPGNISGLAVAYDSAAGSAPWTVYNGSGTASLVGTTISSNTWYHIALVRSNNTLTFYVNGTGYVVNANDTTNYTVNYLTIGGYYSTSFLMNGYISNFRIVKGTAVYTSNFTPPTAPLTAITNTQLLTCQSNRLIDTSTNNFTITRNGDVRVDSFDPFLPDSNFAGRGSGYFDGTGDYLTLPASQTALQPGSGDFTIELWYYTTVTPGGYINIFSYGATGNVLRLFLGGTNSITVWTGSTPIIAPNNVHVPSAWNHVAIVRSGLTVTLYVNGVNVGTATGGSTTPYVGDLSIAFESGQVSLTGYINDFRMVKGTAVYTSNFTPPAAPLTAITNTQLLTLQNNQPNNNSMFLDSSTNNFNITRAGNTTQGSFSPYGGGWSNYFDGTGDYLTVPSSDQFAYGTGNFTWEFWIYPTSPVWTSGNQYILDHGSNGGSLAYQSNTLIYYNPTTGTSSSLYTVGTGAIPAFQWTHIAVVRLSGTTYMYKNGVLSTSASDSNNYASQGVTIANYGGGGFTAQAYISNMRLVKGTAVYTSAFTPSTLPLTPIAGTSLLTCANNGFVDQSGNNFTITRYGDTSIQRFNPFNPVVTTPTSYSGFFDGASDWIAVTSSNAAFGLGTGDFTIECWLYPTANPTNGPGTFCELRTGATNTALAIRVYPTREVAFYDGPAGGDRVFSGVLVTMNRWNHVAVVRSGSTLTCYINGVSAGTSTTTNNFGSSQPCYIGANQTAGYDWNGYISNFRIVKGTAVYTTAFTPSTTPLTAIANTSLLTCQSATFVDASTNNFTITANGNSAPRQFNPFGWTSTSGGSAAYTPALYGGSGYFDGTGDWLSYSDTSILNFGTGAYTVEFWLYPPATPADFKALVYGGNFRIYQNSTNNFISLWNGASTVVAGAIALVNNAWNHVAVVRTSTASSGCSIYVNGVATVGTDATNWGATSGFIGYDGATAGRAYQGYMSDVRISKGVARYSSNFVPPIAPLTALPNTTLLANMTGAGIYDSSMINTYETFGNASINTSIKKYGNTSLFFDGTGDYLLSPASPANILGSGNFTIEAWIYPSNITAAYRALISSENYPATTGGWSIYQNGAAVEVWLSGTPETRLINATSVLTANTWQHVALVRSGSTVTLYVGGTSRATATNSASWTGQRIWIGDNNQTPDYFFIGYMSDVRITPGIARYTTTFTPPSSPFIQF